MLLSAAIIALSLSAPPEKPRPFEFKDGDRVVWIGNTLVEREQRYGYWETALLAANADKKITFRNLGWSGDTVHAEARGRFDFANPDACFKQLVSLTLELKPTVIFVSYGTNESFEGQEGLPNCSTRSSPRTRGSCYSHPCRSRGSLWRTGTGTSPSTRRPSGR
jgi:hypothetical protein